jgi:rhomboid protease GluP
MDQQPTGPTLCPQCKRLISRDEKQCPHCGLSRPNTWWRRTIWMRMLDQPAALIKAIMYVNIGMYALSILLNPTGSSISMNPLTFLSPEPNSLLLLGATGTIPIDRFQRWWSLLSANYLHGGILHIFFNMMAFRQLAALVIREYGARRMLILYTVGGTAGFVVSYLAGVRFTIGASAAVFSLIGAILYYGRRRGGTYGQAIYKQIGGWAVALLIFGFLVPGINNWGHGGGLVAGILLGMVLGYEERSRETAAHRLMASGCAVLSIGVLVWAVATSLFYRLMG